MAIKKRAQHTPADIEAFGDAADQPQAALPERTAPASQPPKSEPAGEWPQGVARSMLIRWPDPALASQLVEATAALKAAGDLDGRSQHATALRALQRGLDAITAEHRG